jgi:hypothetical protein
LLFKYKHQKAAFARNGAVRKLEGTLLLPLQFFASPTSVKGSVEIFPVPRTKPLRFRKSCRNDTLARKDPAPPVAQ